MPSVDGAGGFCCGAAEPASQACSLCPSCAAQQTGGLALVNVTFGTAYSQPVPALLTPSSVALAGVRETALEACSRCFPAQASTRALPGT
jgi:hypothetical protein